MKILICVGTRPNFVKIASIFYVKDKYPENNIILVHTGQHYDKNMSDSIFDELKLPAPDYNLGIGSGTRQEQLENIRLKLVPILRSENPDLVIVAGDVNSTFGCAITSKENGFKVAHIEAGLRSFFMEMPEEINRIETDKISDFLFVSEKSGIENLNEMKVDPKKIFFVGNTMIDTLIHNLPEITQINTYEKFGLIKHKFGLVTLHRQVNVDNINDLNDCLEILSALQNEIDLIFPIHPRTLHSLESKGLIEKLTQMKRLKLVDPQGYQNFINLELNSAFVLTDSGGIQEETTYLNIPCITMRENTERPITLEEGTSVLCGTEKQKILKSVKEVLSGTFKIRKKIPDFWDGNAAIRILDILKRKSTN